MPATLMVRTNSLRVISGKETGFIKGSFFAGF